MQRGTLYSPYEQQPGQCVLIDLTTLQNEDLNHLCDSLKSVLRLNYLSDFGFPRIPFFALCTWNGNNFQIFFDFQNLNVGFNDAFLAVDGLRITTYPGKAPKPEDLKTFLQNFVAQIRDSLNYLKKKPELNVFSASETFSSQFIDLLKLRDVDSSLSSMFEQVKLFYLTHSAHSLSFNQTSGFIDGGNLIVSVRSVICHSVSFDRIFRQWLTDKSVDCAQLQLQLPSLSDKCIYCDILEIMLPPDDLLFKSAKPAKVPVKNLKASYRLPSNRFAHDMLYGCPLKVVPTSCWKMDWEELLFNKGLFEELCCSLIANDEILVVQTVQTADLQCDPFYAFFPEQTSAIISQVVFSEIALPLHRAPSVVDEPISFDLKRQIDALPKLDHWNPIIHAPRRPEVDNLLSKVEK